MSPMNESLTDFERNARAVLAEAVLRVDARTRSRLNQARQRALEAAHTRRRPLWRFTLMPAAGAVAAALLVAIVLWHRAPQTELPTLEAGSDAALDMDLLTDQDAMDLLDGWDGSFYEWAAAQSDTNGERS
jgi:anti-sigma-K factor RskA